MRTAWINRKKASAATACAVLAGGLLYFAFAHGKAANASSAPDLISALPGGAPTVAFVDLAAVRASSFYQHRPDKGPLAVPNQDYGDFVRSTGFDFEKDLDRVAVGIWPPKAKGEKAKTAAIAEGRFDRAKIRSYTTQKGRVEQQQGHEVYIFPSPNGMNSMTFLDDHRVAIVSGDSIAPLTAAQSGDPAGAAALRDHAARVDGAAAFLISRMPPIPADATLPGAQGIASQQLMTMLRAIQWITLAARPEGDNLRVSLEGECDTESNARQLQSTLQVLRMLGGAALEGPKAKQSMDPASFAQLEALLNSIEVTQAAERVRILIELTPDVFKLSAPHPPNQSAAQTPKP